MRTSIEGRNYNFCVVAKGNTFYIEATHTASLRFSFINNLNAILSELQIGTDDKRVSESQWIVSKQQSKLLFKKAKEFLLNKNYRNHIEKRLDKDRNCSEWENLKES